MGITNSRQTIDGKWEIGDVLSSGFMRDLQVISGPHKNDDSWSPDYYIVVNPKNHRQYRFTPYRGLYRIV